MLSVDEKTSIQAKSRKHPDQPARPGRRDAASSNTSVTAPPRCSPRSTCTPVRCSPNRSPHGRGRQQLGQLLRLLGRHRRQRRPDVGDPHHLGQRRRHGSQHTRAWFDAHPRWHVHYTPKHASWVNQVELFFSILQRRVITNGDFPSRDDLIAKLLAFITTYNEKAKPFRWTYAADPLVA